MPQPKNLSEMPGLGIFDLLLTRHVVKQLESFEWVKMTRNTWEGGAEGLSEYCLDAHIELLAIPHSTFFVPRRPTKRRHDIRVSAVVRNLAALWGSRDHLLRRGVTRGISKSVLVTN